MTTPYFSSFLVFPFIAYYLFSCNYALYALSQWCNVRFIVVYFGCSREVIVTYFIQVKFIEELQDENECHDIMFTYIPIKS